MLFCFEQKSINLEDFFFKKEEKNYFLVPNKSSQLGLKKVRNFRRLVESNKRDCWPSRIIRNANFNVRHRLKFWNLIVPGNIVFTESEIMWIQKKYGIYSLNHYNFKDKTTFFKFTDIWNVNSKWFNYRNLNSCHPYEHDFFFWRIE